MQLAFKKRAIIPTRKTSPDFDCFDLNRPLSCRGLAVIDLEEGFSDIDTVVAPNKRLVPAELLNKLFEGAEFVGGFKKRFFVINFPNCC